MKGTCYKLASGVQVRQEDFGLLFYSMDGPNLFFMPCGELLESRFFDSEMTVEQWLEQGQSQALITETQRVSLEKALEDLVRKGVIVEC
jgi:putative mycofactocin binding protein MftB